MATAGRKAQIKVSGSSVSFTGEATSTSDNTTYRITDETKTPFSRDGTITVNDGGSPTAESYTLNRLTGEVTFTSSSVRTITLDGDFIATTTVAEAREFSYTIEADNGDSTIFGDDWMKRTQLLKDFSASLTRLDVTDSTLFDDLDGGTVVVLEFWEDNSADWDLRAWVIPSGDEFSGAVDSLQEEAAEFEGVTDDDQRTVSNNP